MVPHDIPTVQKEEFKEAEHIFISVIDLESETPSFSFCTKSKLILFSKEKKLSPVHCCITEHKASNETSIFIINGVWYSIDFSGYLFLDTLVFPAFLLSICDQVLLKHMFCVLCSLYRTAERGILTCPVLSCLVLPNFSKRNESDKPNHKRSRKRHVLKILQLFRIKFVDIIFSIVDNLSPLRRKSDR